MKFVALPEPYPIIIVDLFDREVFNSIYDTSDRSDNESEVRRYIDVTFESSTV